MPEMKTLTVGGVTFNIADADAVKYVPQTPATSEQEQAQRNINVKNLTVLTSDIEGGHRLVFTDVNGSHVVDLMDGKDGHTPERGIDYYTEAEKKEMVNAVIAALPVYNGEVIT